MWQNLVERQRQVSQDDVGSSRYTAPVQDIETKNALLRLEGMQLQQAEQMRHFQVLVMKVLDDVQHNVQSLKREADHAEHHDILVEHAEHHAGSSSSGTADADEDEWQTLLRGDSHVRGMMNEMRKQDLLRKARTVGRLGDIGLAVKAKAMAKSPLRTPSRHFNSRNVPPQPVPFGVATAPRRGQLWQQLGVCAGLAFTPCRHVPVIHPDSHFRTVWNVLMALLICYCGVMVPFEVAFEQTMVSEMGTAGWRAWEFFNFAVDCMFMIDVVLSFRTATYIDGTLVTDSRQVRRELA